MRSLRRSRSASYESLAGRLGIPAGWFSNQALLRRDSAWSPPIEWLRKVARDYPNLFFRLRYAEEGVGFMGVATAEDGEMVDECVDC